MVKTALLQLSVVVATMSSTEACHRLAPTPPLQLLLMPALAGCRIRSAGANPLYDFDETKTVLVGQLVFRPSPLRAVPDVQLPPTAVECEPVWVVQAFPNREGARGLRPEWIVSCAHPNVQPHGRQMSDRKTINMPSNPRALLNMTYCSGNLYVFWQ